MRKWEARRVERMQEKELLEFNEVSLSCVRGSANELAQMIAAVWQHS
jgi:hypothetical protein